MKTFHRLVQGSVIAGFLLMSSGCIIAPDHEHEHERDRDMHDRGEHRCDDRDEHCRDR
ncbi:MAG: hypothetical protein JWN43_3000 [Gammaproteobacteria bacterium]|nr:hypothetical protein [Gammaproteobacteria bacterium]